MHNRSVSTGAHPIAVLAASLLIGACASTARAASFYVAQGGTGTGTPSAPFGRVGDALAVAVAGDEVVVRPGTYSESVQTVRGGTSSAQRITLRAETDGTAVLTASTSTVLRLRHPYVRVRGLVIDGQYGPYDTVIVESAASHLWLHRVEVRRSSRDCIDMRAPTNVLVDRALIHRCLNATGGRTDAHSIVAGAVRNLTVRNTRIHSFSGDALQLDPGRAAPGWDTVVIDGCQFWLEPLAVAENGFPAGTMPGENAIDTKTLATAPRASLTIRRTDAWGFRGGLISNMAAFNIKEHVDALLDRVTVFRSEIAFRLRGPGPNGGAWARVQNAVVYDVATAVRYEDNIERAEIWNVTLGRAVTRLFQAASSNATGLDVQNVLFMSTSRPSELAGASNMPATASMFANAAADNYHLVSGSLPVNAGVAVPSVTKDRDGVTRPALGHWDIGAYEFAGP